MSAEIVGPLSLFDPLEWHSGNVSMHKLMSAPTRANPTSPFLTPFRARFLSVCNLFAIGTFDAQNRPWTSLWGGEEGSVGVVNLQTLGIKTLVDTQNDPVIQRLVGSKGDNGLIGAGQVISGLGIKLETRDRVKMSGRVAGVMFDNMGDGTVSNAQIVLQVDSSLGK